MIWVSCFLMANVNIATTQTLIDYRSVGQRAGSITMTVSGIDFLEASLQTPVFIRVRLDKGVRLTETLVDVETALWRNEPIHLAMSLLVNDGTVLRAPAHTVSIVRWKEGEYAFWIRIQSTSSLWLELPDGNLSAPDINHQVQWTIGQSIEVDRAHNEPLFMAGLANLKTNVRMGAAVPTYILVNTRDSILEPQQGVEPELNFDTIGFDFQTTGVLTEQQSAEIRTGDPVTANFSGHDTIGIAVEKPRFYAVWPDVAFQPTLLLFNPKDQNIPAVIQGDLESTRVLDVEPGLNSFSLEGFASDQRSLIVEQHDELVTHLALQNNSGHVFRLDAAPLSTEHHYLLIAQGATVLRLINPDLWAPAQVEMTIADRDGITQQVLNLELNPEEHHGLCLDEYLTHEAVLFRVRGSQPIYASLTQHVDKGGGVGWVRSVPPLLAPEEGVAGP